MPSSIFEAKKEVAKEAKAAAAAAAVVAALGSPTKAVATATAAGGGSGGSKASAKKKRLMAQMVKAAGQRQHWKEAIVLFDQIQEKVRRVCNVRRSGREKDVST